MARRKGPHTRSRMLMSVVAALALLTMGLVVTSSASAATGTHEVVCHMEGNGTAHAVPPSQTSAHYPKHFNDDPTDSDFMIYVTYPVTDDSWPKVKALADAQCDAENPNNPDEIPVPTVPVNDPCGLNNAVYGDVPPGNYTVNRNDDGSITLTANDGFVFPGDQASATLPAPTDSGEACEELNPCSENYFAEQEMWEITWGRQFDDTSNPPAFTHESYGGLVTINGNPTTWTDPHLYVTKTQVANGRTVTYGFADGTVITAVVSGDPEGCPSVVWTTTPPPNDQCDDGSNPGDLNGDGEENGEDCDYVPPPQQCEDGTNPGDLNGDGKQDEKDCDYTPPTISPCETSTGSTTVTPSNLQGFDFSETRATGHYEFTEGGLHIWTEGSTSTDKVAGYKSVDVPLAGIGDPSLVYASSEGITPSYQLVVDFNSDGTPDGILVGEDAYGDNWWLSNGSAQFAKDGAPHNGGGNGSQWYGTLDEWLAAFPGATVKAFGFSLGSGVKGEGVLSKITFACHDYVFTADAPPPPPTNPVSPTEPSMSDVCEPASAPTDDTYTVPSDPNFTYTVNGAPAVAGTYPATLTEYVIKAVPNQGTVVKTDAKTEWTFTFTKVACETPPPPAECPEGTTWVDFNDDGNVDEGEGECIPDEIMPEEGAISVVPGCGFVTVTNEEDSDMQFFYGSFREMEPDGIVTIKAGKSRKIATSRHSLDWMAFWESGKMTMAENVKVQQDCDNPPPTPPNPTPPPNTPDWPVIHGDEQVLHPSFDTGLAGQSEHGGMPAGLLYVLMLGAMGGLVLIASPLLARARRR